MEFLNWKNILLEWVNGLNFLGQPYYNLTQTDIETFFDAFKRKITSVDICSFNLHSFIKVQYPSFNPIYNENKKLCHDDYIYVYSLLMHFSCVKYPESSFQDLCKDFQNDTQMIIATFLKNLLERKSFKRDTLETVILASVPAKISDYIFLFSPTKSPNELCPPTPRTKMLNTWSSENKQLKALVETERFEKGFLEIQQKKLEEKISVLTEERRQFIAEIQQLRSQISVKNTENIAPNGNIDIEVLKRRLRKEISDKGDTITKLQLQIDDLTYTNKHLSEKVAYVQSEYNKSIESTNNINEKLALFKDEFEKSQQHVKGLELTIKEYQQYFNESGASNSKANLSDVSVNLDDSYAQAMATLSSASPSCPENLGQVVDLQLREQVRMNDELVMRCEQLQEENSKLSQEITELKKEHNRKTFVLETKCGEIQDENTRNVEKFEEKLREIANLSQEFEQNVNESQLLKNEFNVLMIKANESQQKIDNLTVEKDVLENQLAKFADEHATLNLNYDNIFAEKTANLHQIQVLESKLKDLQSELDNTTAVVNARNSSIAELQVKIEESVIRQSKSQDQLDQLTKQLENCHAQIQSFIQDKLKTTKQNADTISEKDLALQEMEREKNDITAKLKEAEKSIGHVTTRLLEAEAVIVEAEVLRLDLSTKNKELLLEKNTALESIQKEKDQVTAEVSRLTTSLADALINLNTTEDSNYQLSLQNEKLVSEKDRMDKELDKLNAEVSRLNARLEDAKVDLQAAEKLNFKLTAQIEDFILQKGILDKEKDELKDEVSRLAKCLADAKADLIAAEEDQSNFSSQTEELKLAKQQLENEKDQLIDEISRLNICLVEKEANVIAAEELQSKCSARCKELLSEMEQMEEQKKELGSDISCLSSALTKTKADLATSEELNFNLSTRNKDLSAQIINQANQIKSLTADLEESKYEQDKLNATIEELTKQIHSLKNESQIFSSSIADLTNANQSIQLECQLLREQLRSTESVRQEFETQLIQSEDEKEKLFLNLQEKMDEAETIELNLNELSSKIKAIEATNYELSMEKSDLTNKVSELKSNCSEQLTKIGELQKAAVEFASWKEEQIQTNDKLRLNIVENDKALAELRLELEVIHNTAEQDIIDMQHLTRANELLRTDSRKIQEELNVYRSRLIDISTELDAKTKEVEELRKERIEQEQKFNDSEMQRDELKTTVENLKIERDELSVRLQNADRKLITSDEVVKLKNDEIVVLTAQNHKLTTRSEELLIQESKIGDGLNESRELVDKLAKELDENKMHLSEKEKLVVSLNNQMMELSNELKQLGLKLENAELSKENLNVKCASLIDNLETEQKRVIDLQSQSDNFKEQIAELSELNNQKHKQLAVLQLKLTSSQEQITSASMEIESLKIQLAETTHLKIEIEKFVSENKKLLDANKELTNEILQFKANAEVQSYQKLKQSSDDVLGFKSQIETLTKNKEELDKQVQQLTINIEHMSNELDKVKCDNLRLGDENVDLATEIEKVRNEYSVVELSKATEVNALQGELQKMTAEITERNNRVIELQAIVAEMPKDSTKNEEYSKLEADLKVALTDLEAKIAESQQLKQREKDLMKDLDIFSAKLIKNREELTRKEAEWAKEKISLLESADNKIKENRLELEVKLEKMKEKMKHLYTEETSKAKEKQLRTENELSKIKTEKQQLVEKNDRYESHVRQISKQLYQQNDRNLELQKENGILKNQLKISENNPHGQRMHPASSLASIIRMEDEEGQVFNNTYLADLKSGGRISPVGRESVRLSELQIRNSKAAPHLRSTYAAQYGDQNLREEDISMGGLFNDSMMSNQSEIRRGTLYQRPGPPTPSKNGGRLSFGGNVTASDLFPKDILREQNNNAKTKTTPGKLMSIFSSSKPKVEKMRRKSITRPIYTPFTSTPRQKSKLPVDRHFLTHEPNISEIDIDARISNIMYVIDDEPTTTNRPDISLASLKNHKTFTRRYSIISKQRNCSITNSIHVKRVAYRKKGHSKRVDGFLQSRGSNLQTIRSTDDDSEENKEQALELFQPNLSSMELFENLVKCTTSEHPYSNEPSNESNSSMENSLLSVSHLKTMFSGGVIIHGKIPKITVNSTPQRQLVQSKNSNGRFLNANLPRILFSFAMLFVCAIVTAIINLLFFKKWPKSDS